MCLTFSPQSLLERRKNDAKTEEAYLDKILSRDLNTEFIAILKAELKALLQSIDPNNNLEQVPASHSGKQSFGQRVGTVYLAGRLCKVARRIIARLCGY